MHTSVGPLRVPQVILTFTQRLVQDVKRLLIFIGITLGGWLGWWLGAKLGFMSGFILSGIGSMVGVYIGWRINREYFG